MADPREEASSEGSESEASPSTADDASIEELRRAVEEKYDFENFTPEQMAEMSPEEWDAAFDPDSWITGPELLDRVEADLANRILDRDVFARLERFDDPPRLVAYSDEGYAVVYADGSVEGMGTVLRDVKPSVALCSMDDYDVPAKPDGELLPRPLEVPEGRGDLGHQMLQVVAAVQLLVGVVLIGLGLFGVLGDAGIIGIVAGLGFLFIAVVLFLTVANARLSDKFRAEEYRNRLRAVGIDSDEPPRYLKEALGEDPELADAVAEAFPAFDPDEEGVETATDGGDANSGAGG